MRRLSLFTLLFFLAACSNIAPNLTAPQIQVKNVSLQQLSLRRGSAIILIDMYNPNSFALPLRALNYNLSVNGMDVAQGQQNTLRSIPARQTSAIEIPITLNIRQIADLLPTLLTQGKANYQLQGSLALPLLNIPYSRSGTVSL